jgi:hypothetical protein
MPRERDAESGQYTESYPRDAFLSALRAEGGMAGTNDVADQVGCSYELAYQRLRELAENGQLTRRKVANANLWMLAHEDD